jgi:hypothetical protein
VGRPRALTNAQDRRAEHRPERGGGAQVAQRSVAAAAARYGAARSALGLLGPLTWAWLGADLALRALGTDYCRVVRAVFALAQARPQPAPLFTHGICGRLCLCGHHAMRAHLLHWLRRSPGLSPHMSLSQALLVLHALDKVCSATHAHPCAQEMPPFCAVHAVH